MELSRASPPASTQEEFTRFVHQRGERLFGSALLLTGDRHAAEDLTQAALAKVYSHWRRVAASDDPVAYAQRTLHNTYLSWRRLRRSTELPTETTYDVPAPPLDPEGRLDLIAALRALTPLDRAVVVARYWEDRSVRDTATLLDLTEGAVRARAKRALDRLRPLLTDPSERTSP